MSRTFASQAVWPGQAPSVEALRGRRLLVTGAAGYIGGALARRLRDEGLDVVGTTLHAHEAAALIAEGIDARVLDLASDDAWDDLLTGFDVVFAVAAMFQEYDAPRSLFERVNHHAALKLAQTATRAGVQRFVHVSTVGVHGAVKQIPATEETPFNPMDLYHETKLAGELAVMDYARTLDPLQMTLTVNRPSMVYGPGDVRMAGKLCRLVESGRFIMIGNGQVLAHLGYIDDQVDSLILSATAESSQVHAQTFNIASDRPCSLNELVTTLADALGVKLRVWHVPVAPVWAAAWACELACKPLGVRPPLFRRRVGFFTHDRAFDFTKAQRRLGYRSRFPLAQGMALTAAWWKSQRDTPRAAAA